MTDLIEDIRSALDSFDMEKARSLLRDALKEPSADIYYLASLAALNEAQRENFLKQAVELDPFHEEATEALANLKQPQKATKADSAKEISIVPEQTKPKQEIAFTPSSIPTPATKEQPALVVGKLSSESRIILYQIPSTSGTQRTYMPGGSEVILLTRDENVDWYNVVYTASTGQQLLGWAEAKDIHDISLLGNPIEAMDIPIAQFEWNSREDIDALIKEKGADLPKITSNLGSLILLASGGIIVFISLGTLFFENGGVISLIGLFVGIGLLISAVNRFRNFIASLKSPVTEEIKLLRRIKQSKKPDSQRLMENQLIMAAIQTGMNVGSTIITKMVPDKQDITIRNK